MPLTKAASFNPPLTPAKIGQLERVLGIYAQQAARLGPQVAYMGDGRTGRTLLLGLKAQVVLILKAKGKPSDPTPTGTAAALALRLAAPVTYCFSDGYRVDAVTAWSEDGLILGAHATVNAGGVTYVTLVLG